MKAKFTVEVQVEYAHHSAEQWTLDSPSLPAYCELLHLTIDDAVIEIDDLAGATRIVLADQCLCHYETYLADMKEATP